VAHLGWGVMEDCGLALLTEREVSVSQKSRTTTLGGTEHAVEVR